MKETTKRGLDNAMSALLSSPEFDRVRLFLVADASADKSEADEIVKAIGDQIRAHLLDHGRQVRAIAAKGRAV
jgi:hypothetical protein